MTERDFWNFIDSVGGNTKPVIMSGGFDNSSYEMRKVGEYMKGHELLPSDCSKMSGDIIIGMGNLLFSGVTSIKAKEAILIVLAHQVSKDALFFLRHYSTTPDRGLEFFTKLAVDECEMWNNV